MPAANTAKKITSKKSTAKVPSAEAKKKTPKQPRIVAKTIVKGADLDIGVPAPDFKLPITNGEVSLAKLKGKPFVLYFYPKDDTSGCTAEACGFRDAMPKFNKLGIAIVGVSRDSLNSHNKFQHKFDLEDIALAADENGTVCDAYGVWVEKSMYGRKYMGIERSTFLIDGKGVIRAIWRHVSVPGHVDQVRKAAEVL